jgi:hypothetical protein
MSMISFESFTKDTANFLPWKIKAEAQRDDNVFTGAATYADGPTLPSAVASAFSAAFPMPGGAVGFVPYAYPSITILEPDGVTLTVLAALPYSSTTKYSGYAISGDKCYFAPYASNLPVLIFDMVLRTWTYGPILAPTTAGAYSSAVTMKDGRILFVAFQAAQFAVLDPKTLGVTYIDPGLGTITNRWWGGALMPNGDVMTAIRSSDFYVFGIIKADTLAFVSGPTLVYNSAFEGMVNLPDGNILCVPRNARSLYVVDTKTLRVIETNSLIFPALALRFRNGVMTADGKVWMAPNAGPNFGCFDAKTYGYVDGPASPIANAFTGVALDGKGRVICAPNNHAKVGILTPYATGPASVPDSLRMNRYVGRG